MHSIVTVPLGKLQISERNVRKTGAAIDIPELADHIHANGLLQNLIVTKSKRRGYFDVDAGGRRYRALMLLCERGDLALDYPVPVIIEDADRGLETSLGENLQRHAMNPADEVEAFAAIIDQYQASGIDDQAERVARCARRFGVTVRYVEQRLRLSDLAAEVLDALRDGRITLDAAKAYAIYPDHALQLRVYNGEEARGHGTRHEARNVRNAMQGRVYRLGDRQVRYIGVEAYLAAGGRIERELFMGVDDEDVLLDIRLVDQLCEQKAQEEADRAALEQGFAAGAVNTWSGHHDTPPKARDGYVPCYNASTLDADVRATAIAHFTLRSDGSGLDLSKDCCFVPAGPSTRRSVRSAAAPTETAEQRNARDRLFAIERRAVQLAAPMVAGTPLEGRAFWPSATGYLSPIVRQDDGTYVVALLVTIPAEDVEGAMAEAERIYDAELLASRQQQAAAAAEQAVEETA